MSETDREQMPWILVVVLTVLLGSIGTFWISTLPGSLISAYDLGIVVCGMELTSAPFILLLITGVGRFLKGLKVKIDSKLLTYVYTVSIVSSYFISTHWPWNIPMRFWLDRFMYPEDSLAFVPSFMAPPAEITRQLTFGKVPFPLAEWLPSLLYWWLCQVLFGLFMLSIANILRRRYIDVERVPFPHAMAAYESIKQISVDTKIPEKITKFFLIGLIVGICLQLPIYLQAAFPWFPDIFSWRVNTCPSGQQYVGWGETVLGLVSLTAWNKQPLAYAIAYMMPLSVLFNGWFWYLVLLLLTQIAYSVGYYTGIQNIGGCGRAWCHPSPLNDPPFKFHVMTFVGGNLGIAVLYLFLSRSYIIDTLRAAFSPRSSSLKEIESTEPSSYRTSWSMFLVSLVLCIVFLLVTGLSVLSSLIFMFTVFIFWIAFSRVFGLAGLHTRSDSYGMIFLKPIWPVVPEVRTKDFVLSVCLIRTMGIDTPSYGWGGALFGAFCSYRIASLTGVSSKNIFKTLLVAIILLPIVTMSTVLAMSYSIGLSKFTTYNWGYGDGIIHHLASEWYYNEQPAAGSMIEYILVGFMMAGVLSALHARFVWFPFEPIGWIVGWSYLSILWGFWLPFLVAWILKFITLRIGGSRGYEEVGLPFFGGVAAGCMLAIFIGGLMSVIRFFVPF